MDTALIPCEAAGTTTLPEAIEAARRFFTTDTDGLVVSITFNVDGEAVTIDRALVALDDKRQSGRVKAAEHVRPGDVIVHRAHNGDRLVSIVDDVSTQSGITSLSIDTIEAAGKACWMTGMTFSPASEAFSVAGNIDGTMSGRWANFEQAALMAKEVSPM